MTPTRTAPHPRTPIPPRIDGDDDDDGGGIDASATRLRPPVGRARPRAARREDDFRDAFGSRTVDRNGVVMDMILL